MTSPIATTTTVVIHPPNVNPCYGEYVIELKMVDEEGGPFFELSQDDNKPIRADLEDLIVLAEQAKMMLAQEGVKDG